MPTFIFLRLLRERVLMTTSNVHQKTPGAYWKGQTVLNVRGSFNSTETDFLGTYSVIIS